MRIKSVIRKIFQISASFRSIPVNAPKNTSNGSTTAAMVSASNLCIAAARAMEIISTVRKSANIDVEMFKVCIITHYTYVTALSLAQFNQYY